MLRRLAPFTVGLLALLLTAASPTLALGAVVGLAGTPHLWIADSAGVLHWGGDTRALSGKHVNWSDRRDVALTELQTFPIGDPWLSAGLLKDGDPIYQVKWETEWPQPKLLHVQSIKDVELFGINGGNYGNFVIDKAVWEQRYGLAAAGLQRGVLAARCQLLYPCPRRRSRAKMVAMSLSRRCRTGTSLSQSPLAGSRTPDLEISCCLGRHW